jgi:hypothetical protein
VTSRSSPDDDLAAAVLPQLGDLLGDGWVLDGDPSDGPDALAGGGLLDACLPDGFPEAALVAGDEIGFTLPDVAGVYAMSCVFADRHAAALAWSVLSDARFVDCFVSSIAGDVLPRDDTELLGPVTRGVDAPVGDGPYLGARVAVFANVDARGSVPVALRCAITSSGRAVVLLWTVDRSDDDAERRWDHVVERALERCR